MLEPHAAQRTQGMIGVLLTLVALSLAGRAAALPLGYVDVSPSGSQFPTWDGGNTELEFADINGDGWPDLLSIGDHGSPYINTQEHGIMVYFGSSTAAWTLNQNGDFGYGGISIGDVNNDGLLDVAYGMHHNYSNNDFGDQLIEAALGDGTGINWTPWDNGLATSGESYGMFATDLADVDGDGRLDIVCLSFGCCNGLHVYRNNGDGTWTQTWAASGNNAQAFLCTGDVNGDGYPDIAASCENGTIWLNDGSSHFTRNDTGLPGPGLSGLEGVALGDVDGDGKADLAFCNNGGVFVYLWRTDHWESSSTGLPATGNYEVTQLCDMNSDGNLDLVGFGMGTCTIWLGDGAGHWTAGGFARTPSLGTNAFRAGGDIDHNGLADVAFLQDEGSFPSDHNHLCVYRESSIPGARSVSVQFPRGNEALIAGSVQTLRWYSAHLGSGAATVDLDLSTSGPNGPWSPIATGIVDSGQKQWTVAGTPTNTAYLRVTLHQGGQDVVALSRPFKIFPNNPAAVDGRDPAGVSSRLRLAAFPNPARGETRIELLGVLAGGGPGGGSAAGAPVIGATDDGSAGGASAGPWRVSIQDPAGRVRRTLILPGFSGIWDGTDDSGRRLPAGIYLATVPRAGRRVRPERIVLLP